MILPMFLPKQQDFTTSPSPHKSTTELIQNLHKYKKLALKKRKTKEKDLATTIPNPLPEPQAQKK
jgi:hypothetical protein